MVCGSHGGSYVCTSSKAHLCPGSTYQSITIIEFCRVFTFTFTGNSSELRGLSTAGDIIDGESRVVACFAFRKQTSVAGFL